MKLLKLNWKNIPVFWKISLSGIQKEINKIIELVLIPFSFSIDRWLVPPEPQSKTGEKFLEKLKNLRPYQLTLPYWKNNYVYLFFLFSYIVVNVGLFIDRACTVANDGGNVYYVLARACGNLQILQNV